MRTRVYDRLAKIVELHVVSSRALDGISDTIPRYAQVLRTVPPSPWNSSRRRRRSTSPALSVDSLHNIWFEFHEDILALLGRPRETVSS